FQMYFFDYQGKIIDSPPNEQLWKGFDGELLVYLRQISESYTQRNYGKLQEIQNEEEIRLTGGLNVGVPDLTAYANRLSSLINPHQGGLTFAFRPYQTPQDLLFLSEYGRTGDFRAAFLPLLTNQSVDVLGGGFFLTAEHQD